MKNPIEPTWKTEIFPVFCLTAAFAASFYFYNHFPAQVPTHWGLSGQPNGWSTRGFGAFFLPVLSLVIYLILLFLPYLDPKHKHYKDFKNVYHIFKGVIVGFMVALYFLVSFNVLNDDVSIKTIVPFSVGVLFLVLGSFMGKIKSNWFVGVRTPWTLSSETVWNKTHRLTGKTFIGGGLIFMIIPFFGERLKIWLIITTIVLLVLVPIVYSYIAYRQERK